MLTPVPTRACFSLFLTAPPAVRSDFARHLFSTSASHIGVTDSLATKAARQSIGRYHFLSRTQNFNAAYIPRAIYLGSVRSQSTAASLNQPPPQASPQPASTTPLQPNRPSRSRRILLNSGLIFLFFTFGTLMAAAPASEAITGIINRPTNAETLTLFTPTTPTASEINEHIINHPLSKKLRATEGIIESRPHLLIPASLRPFNLTAGPLTGENKIEVPPLSFADKDAALPTLTQIAYLGPDLCGHPDIIHGGLLATMLDEGLAEACFPALPNKVGVTASLKIDYRLPCPASSYVVLKAETTKVEGRKAWVKGWMEILGEDGEGTGKKVVEAEALFIEPKQAAQMAALYNWR